MKRMRISIAFFFITAPYLFSQQFSAGAVFDPSSFSSKEKDISISSYSFSSALLDYFSVSQDSAAAAGFNANLDKSGFTRTEMTAAAILSKKNSENFYSILLEIKKEKGIKKPAEKRGMDPKKLFEESSLIKKEIEKKAGDEIAAMRESWTSTQSANIFYEE